MFYITQSAVRPRGYFVISETPQWVAWLSRNIPEALDDGLRHRLNSNLKHLIVGLELKAALIEPHHHRRHDQRPVLFEPYFQNLILEFCVGAFSVLEGIGSARWLARTGRDGSDSPRIARNEWSAALAATFDPEDAHGLAEAVNSTLEVRDKLHQDRLGLRDDIDWHSLSHDRAFVPARHAIRTILRHDLRDVPETSNLHLNWEEIGAREP